MQSPDVTAQGGGTAPPPGGAPASKSVPTARMVTRDRRVQTLVFGNRRRALADV
jgi:hypothetical protein